MNDLHTLSEMVSTFGKVIFQIVSAIAIIIGGITVSKAHRATSKKKK